MTSASTWGGGVATVTLCSSPSCSTCTNGPLATATCRTAPRTGFCKPAIPGNCLVVYQQLGGVGSHHDCSSWAGGSRHDCSSWRVVVVTIAAGGAVGGSRHDCSSWAGASRHDCSSWAGGSRNECSSWAGGSHHDCSSWAGW